MRAWLLILACLSGCRLGFEAVDEGSPDGGTAFCVQETCAAAGGSCVSNVCEIVSTSEAKLTCPDGMPCRVLCNSGTRPCRDGVDCGGATECTVLCDGYRACQSGVTCRSAVCDVTCNGTEACEDGISNAGACSCHCCGQMSCDYGVASCVLDTVCM